MTPSGSHAPELTSAIVKQQARALGFHLVGIASLGGVYDDGAPEKLQAWLDRNYHGDMAWMANPKRFDPLQVMATAQSIICVGLNYYTPQGHSDDPQVGKISRYGWGRDYHKVLGKRLKALAHWLEAQDPQIETRYYADTGPIQDKVWAQRAGLGWIGKHSNLINPQYGSWFFLGEVLVNLPLESDRPHTAHCGTCSRCIEACPTDAIREPHMVDASRCIAYHTIENRAPELPKAIANNLQGWVAGCDICQDVCPWNQRFAQETEVADFQPYPQNINPNLRELAQLTPEQWHQRFTASALRRIKPEMWRRNAQANLQGRAQNPQPDSWGGQPSQDHPGLNGGKC